MKETKGRRRASALPAIISAMATTFLQPAIEYTPPITCFWVLSREWKKQFFNVDVVLGLSTLGKTLIV